MPKKGFDFFKDIKGKKEEIDEMQRGDVIILSKLSYGTHRYLILRHSERSMIAVRPRHGIHNCRVYFGKSCYGCKRVKKEDKLGNKEFVYQWKQKPNGLMYVVPLSKVKKKQQIKIEDVEKIILSPTVLNQIMNEVMTGMYDPTDIEEMRPLNLSKQKTNDSFGTAYVATFGDDRDMSEYVSESLIDSLPDLEDDPLMQVATDEEIRDAMAGKKRDGGGNRKKETFSKASDDIEEDEFEDNEEFEDDKPAAKEEDPFEDDTSIEEEEEAAGPDEEDTLFDGDADTDISEEEEEELLGNKKKEPKKAPAKKRGRPKKK